MQCRRAPVYAHKCGSAVSRIPAIAAQGQVMKPLNPDTVAMDAHIARHGEAAGRAGEATRRIKNVLAGFACSLFKVPAAPLPGAPHTMPSRPLQTTASCRQGRQYTTS
jgi:hypothetical protein